MNNINIVFGSKRLGKAESTGAFQKYSDKAVVTVEGLPGANKSRRILFNKKAAELLDLAAGEVQEIVFASVEMSEGSERLVLVANTSKLDADDMTTYKTSKNAVAFEDSKEKGKAISSSVITKDIARFLGLDENIDTEFDLIPYNAGGLETFQLALISDSVKADIDNGTCTENCDEKCDSSDDDCPQHVGINEDVNVATEESQDYEEAYVAEEDEFMSESDDSDWISTASHTAVIGDDSDHDFIGELTRVSQ